MSELKSEDYIRQWAEYAERLGLKNCAWALDGLTPDTPLPSQNTGLMDGLSQVTAFVQRSSDFCGRHIMTGPMTLETYGDVVQAFDNEYEKFYPNDRRHYLVEIVKADGYGLYEVTLGT